MMRREGCFLARATRGLRRREGSGQVPFLLAERAHSESARSMRAVKGSLGHSPKEEHREIEDWKALARANGTSRCASGWAGEKVARSWKSPLSPHEMWVKEERMQWQIFHQKN